MLNVTRNKINNRNLKDEVNEFLKTALYEFCKLYYHGHFSDDYLNALMLEDG